MVVFFISAAASSYEVREREGRENKSHTNPLSLSVLKLTFFPFTHSVISELEAMAEPHPKVLNFASTIFPPLSTLICNGEGSRDSIIGRGRGRSFTHLEFHHVSAGRGSNKSSSNVSVLFIHAPDVPRVLVVVYNLHIHTRYIHSHTRITQYVIARRRFLRHLLVVRGDENSALHCHLPQWYTYSLQ